MADSPAFNPLAPGFDFFQSMLKNAGQAMPAMGQWVAPTLNPEEIEKRIDELKTVQFWLEQNARLLGATIQALEVQRMTLSTLKTMNVQFSDLQDAMKIPMPTPQEAPPAVTPEPAESATPGMVDPMQWWGALTQQFTELAAAATKTAGTSPAPAPTSESTPKAGTAAPAPKAAPRRAAAKRAAPSRP